MTEAVKSHSHCLLCGSKNPASLNLNFEKDGENGVKAVFKGDSRYQGYDGIMHGGVISALLDSAMTNCLFLLGIEALTADLNIRFVKSIPYNAEIVIRAKAVMKRFPLYKMKSCICIDDEIYAKAEARFIDIKFIKG